MPAASNQKSSYIILVLLCAVWEFQTRRVVIGSGSGVYFRFEVTTMVRALSQIERE